MSLTGSCPQCGAALPDDAPRGFCPSCLLLALSGPRPAPNPARSEDSTSGVSASPGQFGDYELLGEIAAGGMGVVYCARQIRLNRTVALKMIRSGTLATVEEVRRFRTEAEAAANLDHPNIVPIYEIGEHGGRHYFSMRLIEGGNLAEWISSQSPATPKPAAAPSQPEVSDARRDQRLSPGQAAIEQTRLCNAARLISVIARAVHHAHQRGVLHRDLKPTNILLDEDGTPHLTDFGVAKLLLRQGKDVTENASVLGTPHYMSPEQAAGRTRELTTAADTYSLGAVLFELITGRKPFQGDSALDVLQQARDREPESPRRLNPAIDRDLETICIKCLEKDPGARYGTAEGLADDLDRWLSGRPIQARPIGRPERMIKWARRNPTPATLSCLALLLLISGIVGVLWQWRRAEVHANLSNERLLRSDIANGNRAQDSGEPFDALLWYAEAFRLDADRPDRESSHRMRLNTLRREAPRLLQVWTSSNSIHVAQFNSTGNRVVTVSDNGVASIWNAVDGHLVARFEAGSGATAAAFINDDRAIIACPAQGPTARILTIATGEIRAAPVHPGRRQAVVSPDSRWVASYGGKAPDLRVWNVATGEETTEPWNSRGIVQRVAFSSDGSRLATATTASNLVVWDIARRQLLCEPVRLDGDIWEVAFKPDGSHVAVAVKGKGARVFDVNALEQSPLRLTHAGIVRASYSPSGNWLISQSFDGSIRLWDPAREQPAFTDLAHPAFSDYVAFSPDERRLAAGCMDGTVRFWELGPPGTAPRHVVQFRHGSAVRSVRFSPDGQRVVTAGNDGVARLWEWPRSDLTTRPWNEPVAAVYSTNPRRLLTQSTNGIMQLWDASGFTPLGGGFFVPGSAKRAWFNPGETRLLCHSESLEDRSRRVILTTWDLPSRRLITSNAFTIARGARLWASDDGRFVAVVQSRSMTLHDSADGRALWSFPGTNEIVRTIFHPAGESVAILNGPDLHVFACASGRELFPPLHHAVDVSYAAYSPDGTRLASTTGDGGIGERELRIWDARTGQPSGPHIKHSDRIWHVDWSPDGRWLVTASRDRMARIWDAESGFNISRPLVHRAGVNSAFFSPDSRRIVTASEDDTARVWEAETGDPLTPPLPHPSDVRIGHILDGGQSMFTRSTPDRVVFWELPRDDRPVRDWIRMAMLLSGHHVTAAGLIEPIDAATVERAWTTLRQRYPGDFQPTREFNSYPASLTPAAAATGR